MRQGKPRVSVEELTTDGVFELDDTQRNALGLAQGENLRVIHRAGRVLSFECSGASGSTAVPWDRDLVLTSDVRAFPLADLLNMIHSAGKSGFLLFAHEGHEKSVYLSRGEVVFAASNQAIDRLGETLLRSGKITLEQLREADRRWSPNARFGKVLVELGLLTPRDLWDAVKGQVEEIVRSLFAYTEGNVHFWEGEVQPDNIVRLALPTQRLIEEGLARRDQLFGFLAVLEDSRTRLEAVAGIKVKLSATERALMDAAFEPVEFAPLCRRIGVDPLSAARTIQLLKLVGAIRMVSDTSSVDFLGQEDLRAHDEEMVRSSVYDHVKLIGELAAPLVAIDGAEVIRTRLQRIVDDASTRHGSLLGGLELGPAGVIDGEALLERAIRQPGDRVRGTSEALGELVTYLEFELQNHPRISDADDFLDAVEGLRAKIEL